MISDSQIKELIVAAAAAAEKAYAPYSGYAVGAALMDAEGEIHSGCNVENVSYGLSICAERNAVFQAIAAGERDFVAIAIVASSQIKPLPCGACRQVLTEFCGPEFELYIASSEDPATYERHLLKDLLPHAFGGETCPLPISQC